MARALLGTKAGAATRTRIYLAEGAIEVDEIEGYTGTRKRVLFDEVLLITLDRRRSTPTLVISLVLAALSALTAILAGSLKEPVAIIVFSLIWSSPFWLIFVIHMALGTDYVTVFGKRTTAQMTFSVRKARAREIFVLLQNKIGNAQERERQRIQALTPPPETPEAPEEPPVSSGTAA
jgi:hypothetical protein